MEHEAGRRARDRHRGRGVAVRRVLRRDRAVRAGARGHPVRGDARLLGRALRRRHGARRAHPAPGGARLRRPADHAQAQERRGRRGGRRHVVPVRARGLAPRGAVRGRVADRARDPRRADPRPRSSASPTTATPRRRRPSARRTTSSPRASARVPTARCSSRSRCPTPSRPRQRDRARRRRREARRRARQGAGRGVGDAADPEPRAQRRRRAGHAGPGAERGGRPSSWSATSATT